MTWAMLPATRSLVPADFERALARGDIGIALQPLVNLRSGQVVRLEALARWQDPLRGQISPSTFIPLAESCGQRGEDRPSVRCPDDHGPPARGDRAGHDRART